MRICSVAWASKKASPSSSRWLARARHDPFRKSAAVSDGAASLYVARSAHKLVELDNRHRFIQPGSTILDLGASPGGWTQVCLERLQGRGRVIAVDLLELDQRVVAEPHLQYLQGDLRDSRILGQLDILVRGTVQRDGAEEQGTVQVVLSDMLANTTGNHIRDSQASLDLCELVLGLAQRYLDPQSDNTLVLKYLQSAESGVWRKNLLERVFRKVMHVKPASSRPESREAYFVCQRMRL